MLETIRTLFGFGESELAVSVVTRHGNFHIDCTPEGRVSATTLAWVLSAVMYEYHTGSGGSLDSGSIGNEQTHVAGSVFIASGHRTRQSIDEDQSDGAVGLLNHAGGADQPPRVLVWRAKVNRAFSKKNARNIAQILVLQESGDTIPERALAAYVVPVRKPRDPRPARLCSELAR